jgi:hypothetical protein
MLHTENGILFQTYPIESGTSKNGTPWANQRIIIEQQNGNAVNRLALKVPQKNLDKVGSITPGSAVSFSYIIDCHAYNDRWFTELVLMDIEPRVVNFPDQQPKQQQPQPQNAYNNLFAGKQLRTPSPRAEFDENGDSADLPF